MNWQRGSEDAMLEAFAVAEFLRDAVGAIGEQCDRKLSQVSSYGAERCFDLLLKKMEEAYGMNPWTGAADAGD